MNKEELAKFLVDNFTNENGTLDLSDLDFREYNVDVNISNMQVNGYLAQICQKVKGDLLQHNQEVKGFLNQSCQTVGGDLVQEYSRVKGNVAQGLPTVGCDLYQNDQTVGGVICQTCQKANEYILQDTENLVKEDYYYVNKVKIK